MFSIFGKNKKDTQKHEDDVEEYIDEFKKAAIRKMDQSTQDKIHKVKVIIRGDRQSGKTSLFRRLEGKLLKPGYEPTPEIQVGHIQWSSKVSNEIVKFEMWDVVDEAKVPVKSDSMQSGQMKITYLDSTTVNVYQNCQMVFILIDPRVSTSIEYLKKMVKDVPKEINILVLLNFKDQNLAWDITLEDIHKEIDEIRKDDISYLEISTGNCYGLDFLYRYIDIPFLKYKKEVLEQQLKDTEECMTSTIKKYKEITSVRSDDYEIWQRTHPVGIQYEVQPQLDPKEKAKLEKQKEKEEKQKTKSKSNEKEKKSKEPEVVNIDPAKYIVPKSDSLKIQNEEVKTVNDFQVGAKIDDSFFDDDDEEDEQSAIRNKILRESVKKDEKKDGDGDDDSDSESD